MDFIKNLCNLNEKDPYVEAEHKSQYLYQPPEEKGQVEANNVETASDAEEAVEDEEPPSYSDTDYRNLPLDEKISCLIETLFHRIDNNAQDPDLTCISMWFDHLKTPSSLKMCVEDLCSTLRGNLTDARILLRNIEYIMSSVQKFNKRLVFYKIKVYVEEFSGKYSEVDINIKDCIRLRSSFDNIYKMANELTNAIGYFIKFNDDLKYLKTLESTGCISSTEYSNTKNDVISLIVNGLHKSIDKLQREHKDIAASLLDTLEKKLRSSVGFFDLLNFFGQCCSVEYDTIKCNPDDVLVALKEIKKYLCTHARYYKLYAAVKHWQPDRDGKKIFNVYYHYSTSTSKLLTKKTNTSWKDLQNDLEKLQELIGGVCGKWNDYYNYYESVTKKHQTSRNIPLSEQRAIQNKPEITPAPVESHFIQEKSPNEGANNVLFIDSKETAV